MTPTLSSFASYVHMSVVNLLSRIGSVPSSRLHPHFSVLFSPFLAFAPAPSPPFLPAKITLYGTRHSTVHLYVYDLDQSSLVLLCPPTRLSYTTRNIHAYLSHTHTTHAWPLDEPTPVTRLTSSLSHFPRSVDLSI
ncbi:hypothetical protein PILCRDRAFT_5941 [Piloderma croceum F 1598]|uniref:Uncharacterized protein n=1 Tax=Piloderma croceum (strain F 1598) TaxID=765440 RepID=A0A0C3G2N4_PILCF|nr:hypothetical protein PILCRDRAFT_5941 [Piloderma croceum F 1598]